MLQDFKSINLPQQGNNRYGGFLGINILVRSDIYEHINIIQDTKSQSILWIKLDKNVFGVDFIIGAMYLPHEGSKYHSNDIFENLNDDLMMINLKFNIPVCLMGDSNARTGLSDDFLTLNQHMAELTGLNTDSEEFCDMKASLESKGICTERFNSDNVINSNGSNLIDCCRTYGIRIVNGRFGNDKNVGNYTCYNKNNGKSVVDYAIMSDSLLPMISDFEVDTFDNCLSDVHCPLNVYLTYNPVTPSHVIQQENDKAYDESESSEAEADNNDLRFEWDNEKADKFTACLNNVDLTSLKSDLLVLEDNISQSNVDNFCKKLCNVFIVNATEAGACKNIKRSTKAKKSKNKHAKPWFDKDCYERRLQYYKTKNHLKKIANSEGALKTEGKKYKRFIKSKTKKYFKEFNKKLKNLKSSNPKEYWNILNKSIESKQTISKISLECFKKHFQKLGEPDDTTNDEVHFNPHDVNHSINEDLNKDFTAVEIKLLISNLKSNKACGIDLIRNEFLRYCPFEMIEVITLLFNIVLQRGIIPSDWCVGLIMPLYKKKGSPDDPDNYRGITLLSCIGKLFTAAINYRLTNFLEQAGAIGDEQAGFRAGFSTVDHIFTLHAIIDIYLHKKERLYCAFIDYKKAFDLVDRSRLWMKLIANGINGRIVNAIYNLYSNAKSCVKHNGAISDSFACNVGVRQGENLSPMLFAIYLNDFELFVSNRYKGLDGISQEANRYLCDDDIEVFLRLYVLLYADDTIVMAETPNDLQDALNAVHEYCSTWKLTVNTSKTKIVIFSRGKVRNNPNFMFGSDNLEIVDDYTYLGISFNYNGKFKKAIDKQIASARRAMFILLKKAKILKLPIDVQLELFDKTVIPILLYGAEVWGFTGYIEHIEIFYRKFLKGILHVNNRTPDPMVYGETGKVNVEISIKIRMVNFWMRLMYGKQTKLSVLLYNIIKAKHEDPESEYKSDWLTYIKNIFDLSGFSNIWHEAPTVLSQTKDPAAYSNWVKNAIHLRLLDIFKQDWNNQMYKNRHCSNYRIFKDVLKFEPYLNSLNDKDRINMCKFRCRSTRLPISTSFMYNTDEEFCKLCDLNEIGDEFHYIMKCPFFNDTRKKLHLPVGKNINCLQMKSIFTKTSKSKLKMLASLINCIMSNCTTNSYKKVKKTVIPMYIPKPITRSGRMAQQRDILDL